MPVRVFTATACAEHRPGPGFPEQPARLEAVLELLAREPKLQISPAVAASYDVLLSRHAPKYLDRLIAMCATGAGAFDPDTPVGFRTWDAACGAVGAALAALDYALSVSGNHAFAAIRPPGHHASVDAAMGFCYLNQIAILAAVARQHGRERVLIVDWDVHHGNGTQSLVAAEPLTRFVSMHQSPWWPGSGAAEERGCGNCFNIPMPAGLPPERYLESLWRGVELATTGWTPDLILISAGYDGMRGDPLGGFTLEPEHYATWIHRLREHCRDTPIVGLMEGGYAPGRLAAGVLSTVLAMT